MEIPDDKKIGENDKCIFYTGIFTQDYGDGYKIVIAKDKKTGDKNFLLIYKDKIVAESKQVEAIGIKHDMLIKLKS